MCSSRSNSIIYHRPDLGRTLHVPYSPYTHGALIPTQFRDWFSTSKCHKAEPVLRLGPSSHEYHTVLDHAPYHLHGLARTYRLSSVDGRVRLVAVSLSLYTTYTYISCLLCRRFFSSFFFWVEMVHIHFVCQKPFRKLCVRSFANINDLYFIRQTEMNEFRLAVFVLKIFCWRHHRREYIRRWCPFFYCCFVPPEQYDMFRCL